MLIQCKTHSLFIRLWLINVVSELIDGGHFVFNAHFPSLVMRTDQSEEGVIEDCGAEGVTAVCSSASSGRVELPADGLL